MPLTILTFGCALLAGHVQVQYDGDVLPNQARPPWSCNVQPECEVVSSDGILRVTDRGTVKGQLQFVSTSWGALPEFLHVLEARVKVHDCSGSAGVILLAADGTHEAGLTLYPDHLEIHRLETAAEVQLNDEFHVVRMELKGEDLRVLVDGKVVIDRPGAFTWPAHNGRNLCGFGSLSSAATGEAEWDWVRYDVEIEDVTLYPNAEHFIVYREPDVYACFPSAVLLENGMLVSRFGTRTRRSHIDNTGGGATRVSTDGGQTWAEPPAGLKVNNPATRRADGNYAVAGARGWVYVKDTERERLQAAGTTIMDVRPGTIAYLDGAWFAVREADGKEVIPRTDIELPPTGGMMAFNQNSYLNLGDGVRLVAIYGTGPDKARSAYVLRTEDDGEHWVCLPMCLGDDQMAYNETALETNADGQVIALMRTAESKQAGAAGYLYQVTSDDQGKTWSAPVDTGIWGYPADLDRLPDGRLLATYGYRRAPMGIRACLSRDGGRTWDTAHEIILRADGFGSGSDLGYPITNQLADGTLVTVYYLNDVENVTHICATRWHAPAE